MAGPPTTEVAIPDTTRLLATVGGVTDVVMLQAALLHDTVDETRKRLQLDARYDEVLVQAKAL